MEKERIKWIDAVRGWAIVLVILGHTDLANMNREIFVWIFSFHIPLFFVLSGLVFRIKEERYVDFFKNKIYTLLVPYLVFRILEIVIDVGYSLLLGDQMIRSDIINSVVGIFAQARNTSFESGLWFLPCLFLMQNIMYFIIKNDAVGRRFLQALTQKAREGVEVRLLLDAMGSRQINDRVLGDFIRAGGKRAYFFPPKLKFINVRFNYRNHRKLAVIDGSIGYIGGFNIAREYLGMKKKFGFWRDTHLRVTGNCVHDINARFLLDWRFASKEKLVLSQAFYSDVIDGGKSGVQIVSSGPDSQRVAVKRAYMKMITSARKNVYLQTPYFVPDESILESLKMAAQSGVDVRIMIPCMPDHIFVYWATYSYIGEMVEAGAKCYVYDNGFLHAKTVMVDGTVACVGTANMDFRSFGLNFEVNAVVYSEETTQKLEQSFENDMTKSTQITRNAYHQRSLIIRGKEQFSRLLSPLL